MDDDPGGPLSGSGDFFFAGNPASLAVWNLHHRESFELPLDFARGFGKTGEAPGNAGEFSFTFNGIQSITVWRTGSITAKMLRSAYDMAFSVPPAECSS